MGVKLHRGFESRPLRPSDFLPFLGSAAHGDHGSGGNRRLPARFSTSRSMTRKSRSLSRVSSPRAADPNRIARAGDPAASARRCPASSINPCVVMARTTYWQVRRIPAHALRCWRSSRFYGIMRSPKTTADRPVRGPGASGSTDPQARGHTSACKVPRTPAMVAADDGAGRWKIAPNEEAQRSRAALARVGAD